ncbi:hypothetical protein BH23BAC3_BH23BAC3_28290 [soil metagenome]
MTSIRSLIIILSVVLFTNCFHQSHNEKRTISVTVTDQTGNALPMYGIQIIDINAGWLSPPHTSLEGRFDDTIIYIFPDENPAILKFSAPGYLPKYSFLNPEFDSIELEVRLRSPRLKNNVNPFIIGDFNEFDTRSGIKLEKNENRLWTTEIETEKDTIHYLVGGYSLFSLPGTDGEFIINEDTPTFDRTYFTKLTKSSDETAFKIEFDPEKLPLKYEDSDVKIVSETNRRMKGVSAVFTLMIDEYLDLFSSTLFHQINGNEDQYNHDFTAYISRLNEINTEYEDSYVSKATLLAQFRFSHYLDLQESEATQLLNSLRPDSPIWMIHPVALSTALNMAGVEQYIDTLDEIVDKSPFEGLRGEALFNLIQYYHQKDKEKWHASFFDLTSNYPDHFRATYAYQNFAPEQPISEGKPLPFNEFNTLSDIGTINFFDLEESFLLIDFWATWCGPCIVAMPKLHDIHEEFSSSDFSIVSISVDENPGHVHSFRDEWEMPWHHGHEQQNSDKIREMGIVGVPYYILLGPDRTVISNDQPALRGDDLSKTLNKYLDNER